MMYAPLNSLLESTFYTQCTFLVIISDHCLRKIIMSERNREELGVLFLTIASVSQLGEITWNKDVLKEKVTKTRADCNSAQNSRARNKLFQYL